jgi:membrane protein DedA with SNARE-associated domain
MTLQLLAIALGTFISEDLTAIGTGLLIAEGKLPAISAVAACTLGIYTGDLVLWLAGRLFGPRVLGWCRIRESLPNASVERFATWFEPRARTAILASRFVPGTRLPLYLACGATRTRFATFAVWSFVAVAIWTPVLVTASAVIGPRGSSVQGWLWIGRFLTVAGAFAALCVWRLTTRLCSRRGRQQLAASVSKMRRWEFWPMPVFYAPVALWTAWLAVRFGGYTTITAANPGIADGGLVGESKFQILSRLPARWTIPSALLHPGSRHERAAALAAAMDERGWTFPLVLKPDVGQRGTGVRLTKSMDAAEDYLATMTGRVLVQPYHPGPCEAGVFYYRRPSWNRGRILCITDKSFPEVIGDGHSTLDALIWSHPRYRMQARIFIGRLGARASCVPAAGERMVLGMAGNHAQGALFTDGRALITPALEARIDEIARSHGGFFIGRFDVRYCDRAAFMAGTDLAIVELNGATAECTNIYDPASTLLAAYRQLFLQWRLVFEIGAANRRQGYRATPGGRLFSLILDHLCPSTPFPVSD